ncbi:hypothetical protein FA15DRAFT_662026 [Coprinopsis marcescibilis]|uniref:Uncharacterized protein n=1 Tax=Coprinopsis marcescibilis TaxID=230819 RepID=A0A5C3K9J0_COPMA|nr:hypothetical protein FA15DRAFT_662026 [Coprinopsis marcescibilis]
MSESARNKYLAATGEHPVESAFSTLANSDPYLALSWDRLHTYANGLGSKHIWKELLNNIEDVYSKDKLAELEDCARSFPYWSGLTHFTKVLQTTYQDGTKNADMMKACSTLLTLLWSFLVLDTLASFENHTEDSLKEIEAALKCFQTQLEKYIALCGLNGKPWTFPKVHTHSHMIRDITLKGVTQNYNTKPNEAMHKLIKAFYQFMTNFKNVDTQILSLEQWCYTAAYIHSHIDWFDGFSEFVKNSDEEDVPSLDVDNTNLEAESEVHVHVESSDVPNPSTSRLPVVPKPASKQSKLKIQVAKEFNYGNIQLGSFNNPISVVKFSMEMKETWAANQAEMQQFNMGDGTVIHQSRFIKTTYESKVTWEANIDLLRCNPNWQNECKRFDMVIINGGETGIFGQLHALFTVEHKPFCYGPGNHVLLALVDLHTKPIPANIWRKNYGRQTIARTEVEGLSNTDDVEEPSFEEDNGSEISSAEQQHGMPATGASHLTAPIVPFEIPARGSNYPTRSDHVKMLEIAKKKLRQYEALLTEFQLAYNDQGEEIRRLKSKLILAKQPKASGSKASAKAPDSRQAGQTAKLFERLPKLLHLRLEQSPQFEDEFMTSYYAQRGIISELRNKGAYSIFYFLNPSPGIYAAKKGDQRAENVNFKLFINTFEDKKFYRPSVFPNRTLELGTILRCPWIGLTICCMMFGPASLPNPTSPTVYPAVTSNSSGIRWHISSITPGLVAFAVAVTIFLHSLDSQFANRLIHDRQHVRNGPIHATMGYLSDIVFKDVESADSDDQEDEIAAALGRLNVEDDAIVEHGKTAPKDDNHLQIDNNNDDNFYVADKEVDFDFGNAAAPLPPPPPPSHPLARHPSASHPLASHPLASYPSASLQPPAPSNPPSRNWSPGPAGSKDADITPPAPKGRKATGKGKGKQKGAVPTCCSKRGETTGTIPNGDAL